MNWLKRITRGTVDESIFKRIGWMCISFFLLFYLTLVLSYFLLPEGILRGKHPLINNLTLSAQLWISTLQIAGYNLMPVFLIICGNLIAQKSKSIEDIFVPIGYLALRVLIIIYAMVLGTWSFDVVTTAPSLFERIVHIFDVSRHSGILEFTGYILAATSSFKFTLWYSDGKKIVASKKLSDIDTTIVERIILLVAFVFILLGAIVESYNIILLDNWTS